MAARTTLYRYCPKTDPEGKCVGFLPGITPSWDVAEIPPGGTAIQEESVDAVWICSLWRQPEFTPRGFCFYKAMRSGVQNNTQTHPEYLIRVQTDFEQLRV